MSYNANYEMINHKQWEEAEITPNCKAEDCKTCIFDCEHNPNPKYNSKL